LIAVLAVVDLGYSSAVVLENLAHLIKRTFISELCDIASFWEVFCVVLSIVTLNVIAFHLWNRVSSIEKRKLPLVRIFVVAIVVNVTLTILVILLPGHALLQRSGTYCIPDPRSNMYKAYVAAFIVLLGVLVGTYTRIYLYYKKITKGGSEEKKAQKKRRKLMKRFGLLSISTIIGFVPSAIVVFIQMATGRFAPVVADGLVLCFVSLTCISNPLVYFWSNESARKALKLNLGFDTDSIHETSSGNANTSQTKSTSKQDNTSIVS